MNNQALNQSVKEYLGNKKKQNNRSPYFWKTCNLLEAYNELVEQVKDKDEYISISFKGKSADTVKFSKNISKKDIDEIVEEKMISREKSYNKTLIDVAWIESAFEKVKKRYPEKYKVIECMYLQEKTAEKTAEALNIDVRTVYRWKNKLIEKIGIYLFGSDALL